MLGSWRDALRVSASDTSTAQPVRLSPPKAVVPSDTLASSKRIADPGTPSCFRTSETVAAIAARPTETSSEGLRQISRPLQVHCRLTEILVLILCAQMP